MRFSYWCKFRLRFSGLLLHVIFLLFINFGGTCSPETFVYNQKTVQVLEEDLSLNIRYIYYQVLKVHLVVLVT